MIYVWPPAAGLNQAAVEALIAADAFLLDGSNGPIRPGVNPGDLVLRQSGINANIEANLTAYRNVSSMGDGDAVGAIRFSCSTSQIFRNAVIRGTTPSVSSEAVTLSLLSGSTPDGNQTILTLGSTGNSKISYTGVSGSFSVHRDNNDTAGSPSLVVSGADGLTTIGNLGATAVHRVNGRTNAPAANVIAITNAPFAGSGVPAAYLRININGTEYVIPLLPGA